MFKTSSQSDATRRARYKTSAQHRYVWQFLLFAFPASIAYSALHWVRCPHCYRRSASIPFGSMDQLRPNRANRSICHVTCFSVGLGQSHIVLDQTGLDVTQLPRSNCLFRFLLTWEEAETTKRILAMLVLVS